MTKYAQLITMLCEFQVYSKVIDMYLFFKFSSHVGYYRILSRVPCAIQLVIYFKYSSVYLPINLTFPRIWKISKSNYKEQKQ